ncbi:MAG: hypothetical protein KGI80_02420 [Verrucomicrobiota bacterium]|nr:hypothetical protein [Verrucomicrobiota bacterium]
MKKFSLFSALVLIVIIAAALLVWTNRENILAHFLARSLHVSVSLHSLEIDKHEATLDRLWIGNPPHSQTTTSFAAETSSIRAASGALFENPIVIEEIEIDNIFVGIEFYDAKGTESNWKTILNEDNPTTISRDYLIKTLILRNLTVEVTEVNGEIKRYPTIPEMEFHNINSSTGFPIDEIEKAIFNLMMKKIFQSLPLQDLLKTAFPPLWFF